MTRPLSLAATGLVALVSLALPGAGPAWAGVFEPPARRVCSGQDLRPLIAAKDPAMAERIAARAAEIPFGKGTFFRIRKAGVPDSHLFGLSSVPDPRLTQLPPPVAATLDRARVIALDVARQDRLINPVTGDLKEEYVFKFVTGRSTRADKFVSPRDFERLRSAMQDHGLPPDAAGLLKPSTMSLIVMRPACSGGLMSAAAKVGGELIEARALQLGRPVVELGSLDEEFAAFDRISKDDQAEIARSLVGVIGFEHDIIETIIRGYLDGEIGWLLAWSQSPTVVPGAQVTPPWSDVAAIPDDRVRAWRDAALPHLSGGGVFVAVNAAAIPGATGLAVRLQEAGYTIEPVPLADNAPASKPAGPSSPATKKVSAR